FLTSSLDQTIESVRVRAIEPETVTGSTTLSVDATRGVAGVVHATSFVALHAMSERETNHSVSFATTSNLTATMRRIRGHDYDLDVFSRVTVDPNYRVATGITVTNTTNAE